MFGRTHTITQKNAIAVKLAAKIAELALSRAWRRGIGVRLRKTYSVRIPTTARKMIVLDQRSNPTEALRTGIHTMAEHSNALQITLSVTIVARESSRRSSKANGIPGKINNSAMARAIMRDSSPLALGCLRHAC